MEEDYISVFHFYKDKESVGRCGYCRSQATFLKNDMWASNLTVMDYQHLIDRGWRRSGHYLYKPINEKTCCPMYTIRCDVDKFQLSKSQKKILKNMNEFITRGKSAQELHEKKKDEWKQFLENCETEIPAAYSIKDLYGKNSDASIKSSSEYDKEQKAGKEADTKGSDSFPVIGGTKKAKEQKLSEEVETKLTSALPAVSVTGKGMKKPNKDKLSTNAENASEIMEGGNPLTACSSSQSPSKNKAGPMDGAPKKKAKIIRLENKHKKLVSQGLSEQEAQERLKGSRVLSQASAQLEDFILKLNNERNKLEVKLVRTSPKSEECRRTEEESFMLYKKYQITVHGDKPNEVTLQGYSRFLVNSPLLASYSRNGPDVGYGSFHQQYWINGTLIAVGVIDILPYCVSSVYFFYDPDFRVLSLGTYGSLREISFVRNLKLSVPSIQFYYMGYYIHNCPKMKYKGHFSPSYLLCPETYTWHPIEKCLPKLEVSKYSRLEEDASVYDEDELIDLQRIIVNHRGIEMRYSTYRARIPNAADEDLFRLYAKLIGEKCAMNMLYVIV